MRNVGVWWVEFRQWLFASIPLFFMLRKMIIIILLFVVVIFLCLITYLFIVIIDVQFFQLQEFVLPNNCRLVVSQVNGFLTILVQPGKLSFEQGMYPRATYHAERLGSSVTESVGSVDNHDGSTKFWAFMPSGDPIFFSPSCIPFSSHYRTILSIEILLLLLLPFPSCPRRSFC
jgi:hypothetical protein